MTFHGQPANHQCQWLECCQSWCLHSLECDVPWQHMVVTQFVNPVTRSVVAIVPPREISGKDQLDHLYLAFEEFCRNAWRDGQGDPKVYEEVPPEASGVR
jgi:hypothetical protein